MAFTPVGPQHDVGGIIHVQILHDPSIADPQKAFEAEINAPALSDTLTIGDGVTKDYTLPVAMKPTLHVEIDNFTLLPAGSTPANATALSFLMVFKLKEIFNVTIGSIPITASLKKQQVA